MLVKIFTFKFKHTVDGFDDSEFQNFIKDKNVISIRDYLIQTNNTPYLVLLVEYHLSDQAIQLKSTRRNSKNESWMKVLTESDMGLFNILREWRSEKSKNEGVPPYILFNNNQLAQIVKTRPQTKADLTKIEGIGNAKVEKYGQEILSISKIDIGDG